MTPYSMRDKRWRDLRIGTTGLTIGHEGCLIVSLSMLADTTPDKTLSMLLNGKAIDLTGLVLDYIAAQVLNRTYSYTTKDPGRLCIAETDAYKGHGYPKHFFVWLGNGQIVDSLNGLQSKNNYHVVSYRLFDEKDQPKRASFLGGLFQWAT